MVEPSELEASVLMAWRWANEDADVFSFAVTSRESSVHISKIRRAVRALARKGYLTFCQMSSDDDGLFRGAGYQPTVKGYMWLWAQEDKRT